jgi:hypothetical protein
VTCALALDPAARLASWRAASALGPMIGAISSKGTANMSCRTNATRSAGVSVSSTTSSASPIESASITSSSGPVPASLVSACLGVSGSQGSSGRDRRACKMLRQTRETTVVSQLPRFSTSLVSERLNRSHASWTASSASAGEPSIREATAVRRARCCSKRSASQSASSMSRSSAAVGL